MSKQQRQIMCASFKKKSLECGKIRVLSRKSSKHFAKKRQISHSTYESWLSRNHQHDKSLDEKHET